MSEAMEGARLLVVDDAPATLEVLHRNLALHGFEVLSATSVQEAMRLLSTASVDLVITDLKMPGVSGAELVRYVRHNLFETEVLVISGYPPPEAERDRGVLAPSEFLSKPFTQEELLSAVRRTLDRLRQRRAAPGTAIPSAAARLGLLGRSAAVQKVLRAIQKAALSSSPALVVGEPGTEREGVARAIHFSGPRALAPFVVVRPAGIPEGYREVALFGQTGRDAEGDSPGGPGLFQAADGGTVYLDGLTDLGAALQEKLLGCLRDKEIVGGGSFRARILDVRVIAGSTCTLDRFPEAEGVTGDLYALLSATTIRVPPLRERAEDVAELVEELALRMASSCGIAVPRFGRDALDHLCRYSWPGNLPELENVVQGLVFNTPSGLVDASSLPPRFHMPRSPTPPLDLTLAAAEAAHIAAVLAQAKGNKSLAARILNIDRKTLREKLKARPVPAPPGDAPP